MSHGIWFFAKIDKCSRDTPGYVIEGKVTDFSYCIAQSMCHLLTDGEYDLRMRANIGIEIGVADFGDFAGISSAAPSAAFFGLLEQTHFAEEVSGV